MKDYYKRWKEPEVVKRFESKKVAEFFKSETAFLERIVSRVDSVLDIGCASGRFVDLMRRYHSDFSFSGIDIAAESIENARRLYPGGRFFLGNALDVGFEETFDLVNATGVMQHEPRFEELIERMISWSKRFVLFDVKLSNSPNHLVDIERSYSGSEENRLYFVVLSLSRFRRFLENRRDVCAISIYGYGTENRFANFPKEVEPVISAGVLLEKGKAVAGGTPMISFDIPEF